MSEKKEEKKPVKIELEELVDDGEEIVVERVKYAEGLRAGVSESEVKEFEMKNLNTIQEEWQWPSSQKIALVVILLIILALVIYWAINA